MAKQSPVLVIGEALVDVVHSAGDVSEHVGGGFGRGSANNNPPSGVTVYYNLPRAGQRVDLEFLDAQGKVIRSFTSEQDSTAAADSLRQDQQRLARVDSLVGGALSPRLKNPRF